MTPEELARLWQDGLYEAYGNGQRWDALSEQQKNVNIRVAVKVLEHFTCEKSSMSILDLSALTQTIARMDQQIRRLDTEVFATGVSRYNPGIEEDYYRDTLLGRVNELSKKFDLGNVDQSFFVEE